MRQLRAGMYSTLANTVLYSGNVRLISILLAASVVSGCYDSEQMVERARNSAIEKRLEEIELGEYRATLPFDSKTGARTEVLLRLMGTSVRYRVSEIEEAIEEREFLLRQATLTAIRETKPMELADPELKELRLRLKRVTDEILQEQTVDQLAIAELLIIPQ